MTLFHITLQHLDEYGQPVPGHFVQSVLSDTELRDADTLGILLYDAQTGRLNSLRHLVSPSSHLAPIP